MRVADENIEHLDYFGNRIEVGDTVMRSYPGMSDMINLKEAKVLRVRPKSLVITHRKWSRETRQMEDSTLSVTVDKTYFNSRRFINLTKLGLR